ncbi:14fcb5d2-2364-4a3f-add8-e75531ce234b [Thermothielavioides terrestris]|uniref:GPI anchored serine-rich protein n=2 Tax=Thermothielavioides terrestris TaxID=2587410 RepID=G2RF09_THETT|nr:uncharacterized protein THITE_2171281 [Thermothielavioides terrestris NRRL 8126]AEO70292.1 hypothetical protein THITE_2171281 [Thermothielavioides terrestris NRRL 8126]SPQ18097.1 14fcb5d2-2364-4a3f-add8-e75531ce234b [Thermothielavioides terrestris]
MQFKSIVAVLATGLSFVAAVEPDSTTTSTQTLTKTVTITQCNPTVTNCPARTSTTTTTTTSWSFPLYNSTSSVGPTASAPFIPSSSAPVVAPTVIPSSAGGQAPSANPTAPGSTAIPTGGAGSLFVQPALLLGAIGAGVALLA